MGKRYEDKEMVKWLKMLWRDFKEFCRELWHLQEDGDKKNVIKEGENFWKRLKTRNLTLEEVLHLSMWVGFLGIVIFWSVLYRFGIEIKKITFFCIMLAILAIFIFLLGLLLRKKTPANIAMVIAIGVGMTWFWLVLYFFDRLIRYDWTKEPPFAIFSDPGAYVGILFALPISFITYELIRKFLERRKAAR